MSSLKVIVSFHHDHHTCPQLSPRFHFNQTYDKTRIYFMNIWPSCLEMTGVPLSSVHWCTYLTFPIWLTFPLKDFSNLQYTWTTRNLTKLKYKLNNIINHHSNYFIWGHFRKIDIVSECNNLCNSRSNDLKFCLMFFFFSKTEIPLTEKEKVFKH